MKAVSLVGLALFMLTSLVVGLRVLALWRTTRKLPELLLAIALLSTGFISYALATVGKLFVSGSEDLRRVLTLLGLVSECSGIGALIAFAWNVFHKHEKWAAFLASLLVAAILAAVFGEIYSDQILRYSDSEQISGPYLPLGLALRGTGPAWMSFECLRYHAKLRRQLALGLVSPLVVHRVLLWGVGIGASAIAYVLSVVHRIVYGTGLRAHDWALGTVSFLALISAICIGVAFFPPAAYRRWAEKNQN
jgi:hypothetical protein